MCVKPQSVSGGSCNAWPNPVHWGEAGEMAWRHWGSCGTCCRAMSGSAKLNFPPALNFFCRKPWPVCIVTRPTKTFESLVVVRLEQMKQRKHKIICTQIVRLCWQDHFSHGGSKDFSTRRWLTLLSFKKLIVREPSLRGCFFLTRCCGRRTIWVFCWCVRPIDRLQQQRALALLLRILRCGGPDLFAGRTEHVWQSDSLRPFDNGLTPPEKNLRFLVEGWRNWILHDWLIRKIYHIYIIYIYLL